MKRPGIKFFIIALWLIFNNIAWSQENVDLLFQSGLYAEEVQGNLQKALTSYQTIVRLYSDNRPIAAKAWLHIGFCYEKLGQDKAREAYQKILSDYPDQREIAARARARLSKIGLPSARLEIKINPLVKYYFDRLGIDILTATSPDGKFLAYTDWTTGNLMIKDLATGKAKKLTDANWSRSHEFARRPIWSRDGKSIAYGWYRNPSFTELRIVEVAQGKSRVVYSHDDVSIAPQDWQPDGQAILCNIANFKHDRQFRLAVISLSRGEVQEFLPLDINSRCIRFSPDGKYIAYDTQKQENRHIFVLDLPNMTPRQITSGTHGGKGFDAPIWSTDGKLLLFRSFRLGQYDLWALPMKDGKPDSEPNLVQSNLTNAMLALKGVRHQISGKAGQSLLNDFLARMNEIGSGSFIEDFSSPQLDSSWLVLEWNQPNIYHYASFGRFSLTEHPGRLRYYLDPIMSEAYIHSNLPYFSGWYWLYPGLKLNRVLSGNSWQLETRVTYSMIDGVAGRAFDLMVCFDPEPDRGTALIISRSKDFGGNRLDVRLFDRGEISSTNEHCLAPGDSIGVTEFTYHYRISRANSIIQVEVSEDDAASFKTALTDTLRSDLNGLPQLLILTGNCWFVPANSYADWDYVRFTILE